MEKNAERRSLSWQPVGRCDSFTKKAILAGAPPTSGVYGLYNFDCQVFIGESENIREALLRHERETDFQSRYLQPIGFTFEPCAAELRKTKAHKLIARFCPVLQTKAALAETCSRSISAMGGEAGLGAQKLETYADCQELPVREREKRLRVRRHFFFKRTRGVALAAIFVASAVVNFYLGIPTVKNIQKRVNGTVGNLLARIPITQPASAQASSGLRPQNVSSIETTSLLSNPSVEPTPTKSNVQASTSTPDGAVRFAGQTASGADGERDRAVLEPAKASPIADAAKSADLSKKWSVQISAAHTKDIANTLVQQLRANGFDGYVVQAVVKGQTYYRVRVGHFDAREDAESMRQSLAHQKDYRDAYLTRD